jgi:SPFH domain / Band 7 family
VVTEGPPVMVDIKNIPKDTTNHYTAIFTRIIFSITLFVILGFINFLINPLKTLIIGKAAGSQFDSSDASYLSFTYITGIVSTFELGTGIAILLLLIIWWKYIKLLGKEIMTSMSILFLGMMFTYPAYAYYDKTDYSEAVFILPNQSAFWIPDIGDNKSSQVAFGSIEYYSINKVAAKRFQIPHTKFSGSSGNGVMSSFISDYYVPTGRLILIDRSPFHQEWVKDEHRGTSAKNESFPCQTKEGINATAELTVTASVSEDNASKFLYYFGVNNPTGDTSKPEVQFASVYYGKSLTQVMNGVGRSVFQSAICNEISIRTVDNVNAELSIVLANVKKQSADWFAVRGITIDGVGWAGTIGFDDDIQQAINDKYTAALLKDSLDTLRTKTMLDAIKTAAGKWNGAVPSTVSGLWLIPTNISDTLNSWLDQSKKNKP